MAKAIGHPGMCALNVPALANSQGQALQAALLTISTSPGHFRRKVKWKMALPSRNPMSCAQSLFSLKPMT